MSASFNHSAEKELGDILMAKRELSHVEFAGAILASRRTIINLTVDQIREMASAILVLDHNLEAANRQIIVMHAEADAPQKVVVPEKAAPVQKPVTQSAKPASAPKAIVANTGPSPRLNDALLALVEAGKTLEQDRFSDNENRSRQKFEKAAFAVVENCTSFKRKVS